MKILKFAAPESFDVTDSVIASAVERAESFDNVEPTGESGKQFFIPLLIPANVLSGDKRLFKKFTLLDTPATLLWQPHLAKGHYESVVVGRIDSWEILEDGSVGNCKGEFDTGVWGKEAQRLVEGQYLRKVSADMDMAEEAASDEDSEVTVFDTIRVTGATIVAKPAFQETSIEIIPSLAPVVEEIELDPSGVFEEDSVQSDDAVLLASAAPMYPPEDWFKNPELSKLTPLTIDDNGRVYGHIAAFNSVHVGMKGRVRPPHSKSGYKYFTTGSLRTAEGTDVPVGQITLTGGHASPYATASAAIAHYDATESAVCDVAVGEDRIGIWVAGALKPDVTEAQIRSTRAAAPSGDWRPIGGRLELVAVCQVNVPGFPTPRVVTASGTPLSLCAAGTDQLLSLYTNPLEERIAALEEAAVNTSNSKKVEAAVSAIDELEVEMALTALELL